MAASNQQRTFTNPLGDPSKYTSLHLTAQFRDKSLTVAAFLGYLREDIAAQGARIARGGTPAQLALARQRIATSRKQLTKLGGAQEG